MHANLHILPVMIIDLVKNAGDIQVLSEKAKSNRGQMTVGRSNSHIHLPPNFSAFDTIEEAVKMAAAEKMNAVGVSNYYYHEVYADFSQLAAKVGIFPLYGIEVIALLDEYIKSGKRINDHGNPGRIYICGKGITMFEKLTPVAQKYMDLIRSSDTKRMMDMAAKIDHIFHAGGFDPALSDKEVVRRVVKRHNVRAEYVVLQERHLAQAFQEVIFERLDVSQRQKLFNAVFGEELKKPDDAVQVQGEIRSRMMKAGRPAFIKEEFVSFAEAFTLILELGGIPCYPTLADGASKLCEFEEPVDELVKRLKTMNIHMAEVIPMRNEPAVLEKYVKALRGAGIVVVAGTEHNTLDKIPIEPTCKAGVSVPESLKPIFWEGACVVAAHQFKKVNGQDGFVDSKGVPDSAFANSEDRIKFYSTLGSLVIEGFGKR